MGFAQIGPGMAASPVPEREFSIEPRDFTVAAGEAIRADIRIGAR